VFLLAFVCAAVVFVPMHYVSEGYVTAAGNVAALWAFQLVANSIALLVARRVFPTSP